MGDLTDFVASVAPKGTLRVEENLGGGFVRLRVAEAERRQAKHDIRCVEDIVVEMLRNSRDAGASMVFVATTREGDQRTLVVLDDGCGIPAERMDGLFTGLLNSEAPTDTGRSNMGIGLSVCSAIVKAHGGEIEAANRPGGGAEFRFSLEMEEMNYGE